MCLIVFAWRQHPSFDLLLAANRDEFHARPTVAAHWWDNPSGLFGGRDLQAGGAWCAAGLDGRFAAVTNVREPTAGAGRYSRGFLVRDYLAGRDSAPDWAHRVSRAGDDFAPFNLLVGDRDSLWFVSNRGARRLFAVTPGVYAISNGHWGDDWPKTERAENGLRAILAESTTEACGDQPMAAGCPQPAPAGALFELLAERDVAPTHRLPDTGVSTDRERRLSSIFIRSEVYGTRASTVIARSGTDSMTFYERGFDADACVAHRVAQSWTQEHDARKDGST